MVTVPLLNIDIFIIKFKTMKLSQLKQLIREEVKSVMNETGADAGQLRDMVDKINKANILPSTIGGLSNIRATVADGGYGYSYGSPGIDGPKIVIIGSGVRKKPFKPSVPFSMHIATIHDGEVFVSDWDKIESEKICKKLAQMFDLKVVK